MAPSPEHDKEPKAPDKSDPKASETTEIRTATSQPTNTPQPIQHQNSLLEGNFESDVQESSVSTLDDVQLKSLLDEAINYKTPKDREGKSQIFKDLLQEAEEDERNARAASASGPQLARYYNTGAIGARRHRNRKETSASSTLTHGGSLQDLAQSDLYTDSHNVSGGSNPGNNRRGAGRRHRNQKTVSVSARQREGGSLPSNVNAGARNLVFDDYVQHKKKSKTTNDFQQELDNIKPEYTIVDLTNIETNNNINTNTNTNNINSEPETLSTISITTKDEETSLLLKETRNYSTLDSDVNAPKYRYPLGDLECPEKEDIPQQQQQQQPQQQQQQQQAQESVPQQHKISRHQYFNPLEEYNKLPRIKYTSMAKVDIDEATTNNQVDKAISFSQFTTASATATATATAHSNHSEINENNSEYSSSVRCIVDSGEIMTTAGLSSGGISGISGISGMSGNTGTTATTVVSSVSGRTHALTKLSSDYRLLALPTSTKTMERFKGLDENGNSLHHQSTPTSAATTAGDTNAKKKSKKSKVDRNVSVLYAKDIAGHQADIIQDIDQLVKYIEENDTSATGNNTSTTAKKHIIDVIKKPKRIKTKSETSTPKSNLKKSNSLEEISKTKFADLMNHSSDAGAAGKRTRVKKQSTSEDGGDRNNLILNDGGNCCKEEVRDRRSWGTEDSQQYMMAKQQFNSTGSGTPDPQLIHLIQQETADFHVVTKKKKSKKRNMTNNHGNRTDIGHRTADHNKHSGNTTANTSATTPTTNSHGRSYHRNAFSSGENSVPTRRKSACSVPPSDKSGESSDVDSVHSLPAATTRQQNNNKNNTNSNNSNDNTSTELFNDTIAALVSAPPGSNTSYADIAKNNNLFNSVQLQQQQQQQQVQQQPQQQQQQQQQHVQQKSAIALKSSEHFPELLCTLDAQPQPPVLVAAAAAATTTTTATTPTTPSTNSESSPANNKQLMCVVNKTSEVRPQPKINNARRGTNNNRKHQQLHHNHQQQQQQQQHQHQRPAVIILNDCTGNKDDLSFVQQSPSEPIQVSGLTFGFELNEQLLNDEPIQQQHQQTEQQPPQLIQQSQQQPIINNNNNNDNNNSNNNFCARFLAPPSDVKDNYNHDKIVQFIGMAWEELIHDNKGKIQYYNGQ